MEKAILVSTHADKRIRKRMGLKRKAVKRFAEQAVCRGEEVEVKAADPKEVPRRIYNYGGARCIYAEHEYKLVLLTVIPFLG